MSNNDDFNKPNAMPDNISFTMPDDDEEEVTRRIGGFNPSFAPTNPSFNTPLNPSFAPTTFALPDPVSTFSTEIRKAETQTQSSNLREKFTWKLHEAPTLPRFYSLERTAVFVPHSTSSSVSARISDVIRERSIEASFDNSNGKASCVSEDGVDFRIRLYRGRNQHSHGIIVEVQRRFGTSVNFQSDAKAILDAAEGKKPEAPPKDAALPQAEADNFQPDVSASLSMVSKMMSHPGYDAQYLAMQTLSSLTDPAKVGLLTASSISKELLRPGNVVGYKVANIILTEDKTSDSYGLKAMALTILGNTLQVTSVIPDVLLEDILPVLRKKLMNAEDNPRMAHIAAKCVEHIIEKSHGACDLSEVLESAAQVGNAKHAGLMRQAEKCLQKIVSR